ncbi:hypothetical protein O9929_13575 [Vibrio lentus]|nr:hypothetical protein [Vibrio lentus]
MNHFPFKACTLNRQRMPAVADSVTESGTAHARYRPLSGFHPELKRIAIFAQFTTLSGHAYDNKA